MWCVALRLLCGGPVRLPGVCVFWLLVFVARCVVRGPVRALPAVPCAACCVLLAVLVLACGVARACVCVGGVVSAVCGWCACAACRARRCVPPPPPPLVGPPWAPCVLAGCFALSGGRSPPAGSSGPGARPSLGARRPGRLVRVRRFAIGGGPVAPPCHRARRPGVSGPVAPPRSSERARRLASAVGQSPPLSIGPGAHGAFGPRRPVIGPVAQGISGARRPMQCRAGQTPCIDGGPIAPPCHRARRPGALGPDAPCLGQAPYSLLGPDASCRAVRARRPAVICGPVVLGP